MTILQAAAAITLWRSGKFDTLDIAKTIGVTEADTCRIIQAARDAERQSTNADGSPAGGVR